MESEKIEKDNSKISEALLSLLKTDSLGKMSAIILGVIYLCGFLTLNSHLYKYGVVELGIASTEYLVAGAVFVLYLAIYGVFAGRSIILSGLWLGQHIDHLTKKQCSCRFAHHCIRSYVYTAGFFSLLVRCSVFYFCLWPN